MKLRQPDWHLAMRWAARWGLLTILALVPTISNFLSNRYQVSVQDLLLPVILAMLTGLIVVAALHRLWMRDRLAGLTAATLATLLLSTDFEDRLDTVSPLFHALLPVSLGGFEQTVFAAVLAVLVIVLAAWIGRLVSGFVTKRQWKAGDVTSAIVIAVAATSAFMLVPLVTDLASEWSQFFYHPAKIASAPAKAGTKPDIYYIIMEDYASKDVLQSQFGFDNSNFLDYLTDKGYRVNPTARVNYPYTAMSVASTLSAGYLNDIERLFGRAAKQTVVPFNQTIRESPVAQALKSGGYKYTMVGNWYEGFNLSPVADKVYQYNGLLTVLGHTFVVNNFPKYRLTGSLFGPLVEMGIHIGGFTVLGYANAGDVDLAHEQLAALKQLAAAPSGGRFIMADILVPHEAPFYFHADGSISTNISEDNVGEPVKKKYTNEVQYINGQMKTILDEIDQNSHGQAVVALLSDEGPQLFDVDSDTFSELDASDELQSGNMGNWSAKNLALKFGTLAAFKLPGIDASKVTDNTTSSVNIFRLVLNSYLGYNLSYLPDCYYAYPDGRDRPEAFASITSKITGQPEDPRCSVNGLGVPKKK